MDKLLKVDPGFADKEFMYQKEILQKKLKKSNLDLNEKTLQEYILASLFQKEVENEEVIQVVYLYIDFILLSIYRLKQCWTTIQLPIGRSDWIQFSMH